MLVQISTASEIQMNTAKHSVYIFLYETKLLWIGCNAWSTLGGVLMGSCARELLPPGRSPAECCLPLRVALV